jgi:hypothetical protein
MTNTRARLNDTQRRLNRTRPAHPHATRTLLIERVAGNDDPYHAPLTVLKRQRFELMDDRALVAALYTDDPDSASLLYADLSEDELQDIIDITKGYEDYD